MAFGDSAKYRRQAVEELAKFRLEWDKHVQGQSLLTVTAPVGLVLADVAERLDLTPAERFQFLGKLLLGDLQEYLSQPEELE